MKSIKSLIYIAIIGILLGTNSCIKDIGNYDYVSKDEVLPIKIVKIENANAILGEDLIINPTIENMTDESKYSFMWYTIPAGGSGDKRDRDTISNSKNLSFKVRLAPETYYLYYEVRDIERDVYVNQRLMLYVSATPINTGWYVLKDSNDETDFDYINREGKQISNVLNLYAPNKVPKGTAVKISYQNGRYYHQITKEDGTKTILSNLRIFHILTSKDVKTFNAITLVHYKDFNDQFYGNPPTCNPQNCKTETTNYGYLLNNGQLHNYYSMGQGLGKFGAGGISEYPTSFIHNEIMVNSASVGIGFDTINRSFVVLSGGTYTNLFNEKAPLLSPSKMEYRLINLLQQGEISDKSDRSIAGFAIMKKDSPNDKNFYFLPVSVTTAGSGRYPFLTQPELIPATARMPQAPVKAASREGRSIYFSYDNILYSYIHATATDERETLIKTFPADEKIGYMKEFKRAATTELPAGNQLIVVTNSSKGWKMYGFTVISPGEINPNPQFIYEGTGTARDVLYR